MWEEGEWPAKWRWAATASDEDVIDALINRPVYDEIAKFATEVTPLYCEHAELPEAPPASSSVRVRALYLLHSLRDRLCGHEDWEQETPEGQAADFMAARYDRWLYWQSNEWMTQTESTNMFAKFKYEILFGEVPKEGVYRKAYKVGPPKLNDRKYMVYANADGTMTVVELWSEPRRVRNEMRQSVTIRPNSRARTMSPAEMTDHLTGLDLVYAGAGTPWNLSLSDAVLGRHAVTETGMVPPTYPVEYGARGPMTLQSVLALPRSHMLELYVTGPAPGPAPVASPELDRFYRWFDPDGETETRADHKLLRFYEWVNAKTARLDQPALRDFFQQANEPAPAPSEREAELRRAQYELWWQQKFNNAWAVDSRSLRVMAARASRGLDTAALPPHIVRMINDHKGTRVQWRT